MEGVVYENGMVGLKKDYFYAGRVDKSVFTIDTISPDDNLWFALYCYYILKYSIYLIHRNVI